MWENFHDVFVPAMVGLVSAIVGLSSRNFSVAKQLRKIATELSMADVENSSLPRFKCHLVQFRLFIVRFRMNSNALTWAARLVIYFAVVIVVWLVTHWERSSIGETVAEENWIKLGSLIIGELIAIVAILGTYRLVRNLFPLISEELVNGRRTLRSEIEFTLAQLLKSRNGDSSWQIDPEINWTIKSIESELDNWPSVLTDNERKEIKSEADSMQTPEPT